MKTYHKARAEDTLYNLLLGKYNCYNSIIINNKPIE